MKSALGFTGNTFPWKSYSTRLCRISRPIDPARREAPTTAIDWALKMGSRGCTGTPCSDRPLNGYAERGGSCLLRWAGSHSISTEGVERPQVVRSAVAEDVDVTIIGPNRETLVVGPVPLVEDFPYLEGGCGRGLQPEAKRSLVRFVPCVALDFEQQAHRGIFGLSDWRHASNRRAKYVNPSIPEV